MIRTTLSAIILISGLLLAGTTPAEDLPADKPSKEETILPGCPSSPNCVNSLANDKHFINPLHFAGENAATIRKQLLHWLEQQSNVTVTETGLRHYAAPF